MGSGSSAGTSPIGGRYIGSVCGVRVFSWYVTYRGEIGDIGSVYGIKVGSGSSAGTSPIWGEIGDMGSVYGVRIFSWYVTYRGEIHGVSVGSGWGQDLQLVRHL